MEDFHQRVTRLPEYLATLVGCTPCTVRSLPRQVPESGIYLFSEGDAFLYVGRSRRLRARVQEHCRRSSKVGKAAFAALLARDETGIRANYRVGEGRSTIAEGEPFASAFARAKTRIASMHLRFAEVPDPVEQALFEIFVAVELACRYNDFDTH